MDRITKKLFTQAKRVRQNAFAPISHYKVGAAALTKGGRIFSACNVESATVTLTTHAEAAAIDQAVAAGERTIVKIIVVVAEKAPVFPCGLCRQKIAEFSGNAEVIAVTMRGATRRAFIKDLYPEPFVMKNLEK
ncbi:MAG: cytidine deaminase [bacterium]|nr:cytidine deaminase [bacterium]